MVNSVVPLIYPEAPHFIAEYWIGALKCSVIRFWGAYMNDIENISNLFYLGYML
jgi:hypothetical protein